MAAGEGVDTVIGNCEEVCKNVIRNRDDCDVSWEGCNFLFLVYNMLCDTQVGTWSRF